MSITERITLATLSAASAQQVFDQVATHLLTQRAKSLRRASASECAYRGANETMCAAGCLMSDEEYAEASKGRIEGMRWSSVVLKGHASNVHCGLIGSLQCVHDAHDPSAWLGELICLAADYQLSDAAARVPA